ncbi:hypothetical protein [Stenotrophomonas phage BUCT603B1]|nr:hypothetical protein [Stenotrophomonas phage BUCT603B1]HDS1003803.1 hypothetical protein [Stenotrophomonas maltophilia]
MNRDTITIRIASTVCQYVGSRLGNLHDYCADGLFDPRSNAYKLGMRTHAELEDLQRRWPTYGRSGHATRNVQLTRLQWLVIRDRIEFAWEIASDNGADGDREAARFARTCRGNVKRIDAALRIFGE